MNPESNIHKYVLSVIYHSNHFNYFVGHYNLDTDEFAFSNWSDSFKALRSLDKFTSVGIYRNYQSMLDSHNKNVRHQIMIPITHSQAIFLLDNPSHAKVQSMFPELFI